MGIAYNGKKLDGLAVNGKKIAGIAYNGEVIYNANKLKIYGIKRAINQSSPKWERTDDAIGLYAEATHDGGTVRNDFDNLYPWSDIITCNYDTTQDKIVAYINDSSFKFDGNNGQVMTIIPEFWYKRWQADGYEYIQIASNEVEGFTKSEQFMLGRYTISGSSDAVYSRSGQSPLTYVSIKDFNTYAQKIGKLWRPMDWHFFLVQILYLVEYADYNCQSILGMGQTNGDSILNSGGCNSLGMKSGCLINDGAHSIIYRGLEDIYGNIEQFLYGMHSVNRSYSVYITYYPKESSSRNLSYKLIEGSGYTSKLGYDKNQPLVGLPIEQNGSDSTYMTDYSGTSSLWGSVTMDIYVGGYYSGGQCGLWYWRSNGYDTSGNKSYKSTFCGARLIKY